MKRSTILNLTLCALFAALAAVCSQLVVPLPWMVPINMAHVAIFMAAGLLGAKYGTVSVTAFVLLGAAGVPVYSEFTSGLSVLFGATGGYIFGYILTALTVGLIVDRLGRSAVVLLCAMALGMVATYVLGASWYYLYYHGEHTVRQVLLWCVTAYLPGDAVKIVLCTVLIRRLHPVLARLRRQWVKAA